MNNRISLIYLLGAGRSGTTLLAIVLNNHQDIKAIGEMHQFVEHLKDHKQCSCGELLQSCPFWNDIINDLGWDPNELANILEDIERKEEHKNILKLLLSKKADEEYLKTQTKIFGAIHKRAPSMTLLDSSKYIARYLLLKRSDKLDLKGVYVIRDVRGVINSFSKEVQTKRGPLSTIFYYMLVNFFGQIVSWLDKDIIKVKYEDLIEDPMNILNQIYTHTIGAEKKVNTLPGNYEMPHIIGGNRMKVQKNIKINKDFEWKSNISRRKQILYYILASPIMIINNYRS